MKFGTGGAGSLLVGALAGVSLLPLPTTATGYLLTENGVQYMDDTLGSGAAPQKGDLIVVRLTTPRAPSASRNTVDLKTHGCPYAVHAHALASSPRA